MDRIVLLIYYCIIRNYKRNQIKFYYIILNLEIMTKVTKITKKENKVSSAKASTAAKTKPSKKDEAALENTKNNVEVKAIARDVKYIYPETCNDKDARKKFRTTARATWKRFQREMGKTEDEKATKKIEKEMNAFLKETYKAGIKATIAGQ